MIDTSTRKLVLGLPSRVLTAVVVTSRVLMAVETSLVVSVPMTVEAVPRLALSEPPHMLRAHGVPKEARQV